MLCGRLPFDDRVDFGQVKTGQLYGEVHVDQTLQLNCQDLVVPPRLFGQTVVGQDLSALFCVAQVINPLGRDLGPAKQLRRLNPTMARDDAVLAINEHRVYEAKLLNQCSDFADLTLRMGPRLPIMGLEPRNRDWSGAVEPP